MTAAVPTKRQHTPNSLPSGQGVVGWFSPIMQTSVGAKFVVALTGLGLTGFVIMHLLGNLQIFMGQEKINNYAKFLKDLGAAPLGRAHWSIGAARLAHGFVDPLEPTSTPGTPYPLCP